MTAACSASSRISGGTSGGGTKGERLDTHLTVMTAVTHHMCYLGLLSTLILRKSVTFKSIFLDFTE